LVLLRDWGAALAVGLVGNSAAGGVVLVCAFLCVLGVRRSAPGFVLLGALHDERFYADATAAGLLK
jgi:hypothetical protein